MEEVDHPIVDTVIGEILVVQEQQEIKQILMEILEVQEQMELVVGQEVLEVLDLTEI